ncbi:hypothetical protein P3T29_004510 [Kitasatospora sp. MAP5-34]|nr:hypothetical protein [Kitasatospora sp. MAP5-34]
MAGHGGRVRRAAHVRTTGLVITALLTSAACSSSRSVLRFALRSAALNRRYFCQPTLTMSVSARLLAPKLASPLRTATMLGRW